LQDSAKSYGAIKSGAGMTKSSKHYFAIAAGLGLNAAMLHGFNVFLHGVSRQ
jgi:hypothetical protein